MKIVFKNKTIKKNCLTIIFIFYLSFPSICYDSLGNIIKKDKKLSFIYLQNCHSKKWEQKIKIKKTTKSNFYFSVFKNKFQEIIFKNKF